MNKLVAVLVFGMLVALSGGAAVAGGAKAINFQFTDINGKTVRLSDFQGKWVLVNFWAPWCPLCWAEVPTLNELNKRKDVVVIGVGLDYGPDENVVRETAARHGLNFTSVVAGGSRRNPDSPFRQVGPVDFYPTSYLYDPQGEIVMFIPGQIRMNRVLAFMESHAAQTQMAGGKQAEREPVREVTHSKPTPAAAPAARGTEPATRPATRRPAGGRTVTY